MKKVRERAGAWLARIAPAAARPVHRRLGHESPPGRISHFKELRRPAARFRILYAAHETRGGTARPKATCHHQPFGKLRTYYRHLNRRLGPGSLKRIDSTDAFAITVTMEDTENARLFRNPQSLLLCSLPFLLFNSTCADSCDCAEPFRNSQSELRPAMPKKSLLPFLILGLGFIWAGLCEWLRRRSLARRQDSDLAPGTHQLVGMAGLLLCMIAAGVAAYLKWMQ
jgi:hypothetical protein